MDPSSFGILAYNYLRVHSLASVVRLPKHMMPQRSSIIPFVYVGEEILKYMWYEVSMIVFMGRIVNQRTLSKWLPFENYMSESLNIWCAYMEAYVYMCTKYEVSMSNPVARGGVHRWRKQWYQRWWRMMDNTWLNKALWFINEMSQKLVICCGIWNE